MLLNPLAPFFLAEVAAIDASDRLRPLDPARVEALAASINEIGLRQPINVRPGADGSNSLRLVAGGHRLAAFKLLGLPEIPAVWDDLDDATARLVEIDENLIRNELSELDRAIALTERKRIYEALHPETKHGGNRKPKTLEDQVANLATWSRFSKDAASRTGLSERVIQRSVNLIAELSPEAIALVRSSPVADNQAQLAKLSKEPKDHQVAFARELAEGRAKTVQRARVSSGYHPEGGSTRPAERGLEAFERICHSLPLDKLLAARGILDQIIKLAEEADTKVAERKAAKDVARDVAKKARAT